MSDPYLCTDDQPRPLATHRDQQGGMSAMMQSLGRQYVGRLDTRYRRTGTRRDNFLFLGNYSCIALIRVLPQSSAGGQALTSLRARVCALKFGHEIRTPAMQAGLATRRLTFREVFVLSAAILIGKHRRDHARRADRPDRGPASGGLSNS